MIALSLLLWLWAACQANRSPPVTSYDARGDARDERPDTILLPEPDAATACRSIEADFKAAVALGGGGTCDGDGDCTFVGGQVGQPTCNCEPNLGRCEGTAIAKNAPGYADAVALATQFAERCADKACGTEIECTCDCAPPSGLHCTNHVCVGAYENSCFPPH